MITASYEQQTRLSDTRAQQHKLTHTEHGFS